MVILQEASMKRILFTALLGLALSAGPSRSDPEFRVSYPGGVARVEIAGDWRQSHYSVWRAPDGAGPYERISDSEVLCVGPCYAEDFGVVPGRTYFYRFDVTPPTGASPQSFGPYTATISHDLRMLSASLDKNPGRGPTRVTLFYAAPAGGSVHAEASIFDLQGRRMATIFRGPLAAGRTQIPWNGQDMAGRELRGGVYLLRVMTADGRSHVARVVRSR
jgi:hypothetical protein